MASRINKTITEEGIHIAIKAYSDSSKQRMLGTWLLAFTVCGLAIISQVFTATGELRIMLTIFFFFWAYFEYKVVKVFRWRRKGEEQFLITEDKIQYGRTFNNRGFLRPYRKDLINKVRFIDADFNNFAKTFNASYWVIGGERLAFTVGGKMVAFGLDLDDKEAKKMIKLLNEELR